MDIILQPTPNPDALKFIASALIKTQGSSTYRTPLECAHNPLAMALFSIRGVDQIHIFNNSVTITKFGYQDWDNIELTIIETIKDQLSEHNPDYEDPDPEKERRENLTPELKEIESIMDRTIRPGLQADGGDIQCLSYEDNVLLVKYQGACGTCPSSTTGTLEGIRSILRHEYNPEIDVYIAPDY
ncbi:MAG: NifU family protein [Halobacteriovoraceae bacterium]|nr:NifU family protein [Halobacteriovoraceae bacterium]